MASLPDVSTNAWKENIIVKYEKHPAEIEDMCLANFVSKYRLHTRTKCYVLCDTPVVIRYRHYMQGTSNGYRHEHVLYVLFKDEAVQVQDNNYNQIIMKTST